LKASLSRGELRSPLLGQTYKFALTSRFDMMKHCQEFCQNFLDTR